VACAAHLDIINGSMWGRQQEEIAGSASITKLKGNRKRKIKRNRIAAKYCKIK